MFEQEDLFGIIDTVVEKVDRKPISYCSDRLYVVIRGRAMGIYKTWDECREQVDRFRGAKFKGFYNIDDAIEYMKDEDLHESFINEQISKYWRDK